MMLGSTKEVDDFSLDRGSKPRVIGRQASDRMSNVTSSPRLRPSILAERRSSAQQNSESPREHHALGEVFMQMAGLIREAKAKRRIRKTMRQFAGNNSVAPVVGGANGHAEGGEVHAQAPARRPSSDSQESFDLEKMEDLLEKGLSLTNTPDRTPSRNTPSASSRPSSSRKLRTLSMNVSSDTDYHQEGDVRVPSCEAILDNSKTLSYVGGGGDASELKRTISKNPDAWETFKFEIVRLTHTLKLKGWRQVPMDRSREIDVERLSGALTNAVYVVSPPRGLLSRHEEQTEANQESGYKRPPL